MTKAKAKKLRRCLGCGKEFTPKPRNPTQLYCDRVCYTLHSPFGGRINSKWNKVS